MRRLLLDIEISKIREAFEICGHRVADLSDNDLLDYAVAVMGQEHDELLDEIVFGKEVCLEQIKAAKAKERRT